MLPLIPFVAAAKAATALTITVGQAIGIGTTVLGIGAGLKGAIDYQNAKN